jgi:hypothetical protein
MAGMTPPDEDPFGPRERPPDPPGWPYADLHLATPNCPYCGWQAKMMVGTNVHPMAFCSNDDCPSFNWDPSVPAAKLLAEAVEMVEETLENGTTVIRPGSPSGDR